MSRVIKFRAWDEGAHAFMKLTSIGNGFQSHIAGTILEQFTGLLDKNGKEIYEGDVVSITSEDNTSKSVAVQFAAEYGGFVWDEDKLFGGEYLMSFSQWPYDYVVVGNIHENPDLLK